MPQASALSQLCLKPQTCIRLEMLVIKDLSNVPYVPIPGSHLCVSARYQDRTSKQEYKIGYVGCLKCGDVPEQ